MPEFPMGVSGGNLDYGVFTVAGHAVIFFHGDDAHKMKIPKHEFMTVETILEDMAYYIEKNQPENVFTCAWEGIQANQNADKNWKLYALAGEALLRMREREHACNMLLKAYQCEDCDQKAHMLCEAAMASCLMQEPKAAYNMYMKALEEEPDSLEAHHDLGGLYWDLGELELAAQCYFTALKTDPTYYNSYEELSNLFAQLGDKVWPKPFMDCFKKKKPLAADQLAAAEADMQKLMEKQGKK